MPLLSGLGPAHELAGLGIQVVEDLPGVGQNMADHAIASIDYQPAEGHEPLSHEPRIQIALITTAPSSDYCNDLRFQPASCYRRFRLAPPTFPTDC